MPLSPVKHYTNQWTLSQCFTIIDYFSLCQSLYILIITLYARHRKNLKAFANSCKDYKIDEHSRNTSGGTFGNFRLLSLTTSACSVFI